jgi:hypothetical protein
MATDGDRQTRRAAPIVWSIIVAVALFAPAQDATAYIGPGMAAGAVASVLGILAGIILVLVGIIWYPIKALLRKWKQRKE